MQAAPLTSSRRAAEVADRDGDAAAVLGSRRCVRLVQRLARAWNARKRRHGHQDRRQAGTCRLSRGLRGADWIGVKLLSLIAFGVVGALLGLVLGGGILLLLIGVVGAAVGYIAPEFWLGKRISKRSMDMVLQLPDALDLLTISVEAGLGFDAALAKVVEKMEGPLVDEFRRRWPRSGWGVPRREALRDVATAPIAADDQLYRRHHPGRAAGCADRQGASNPSNQLRIERRQRAEETAAKAPVKMLFPMVGCIFPTIFIVILGPAVIGHGRHREL